MRFNNNSSLFVNTGRKPLSAMQRRKKNNRNNIFLGVCLGVIAVLCIFVGLIVRVWLNYDEAPKEPVDPPAVVEEAENKVKEDETAKKEEQKALEEKKRAEEEKKKKEELKKYKSFGEESDYSKALKKAFSGIDGEYAYGYYLTTDGSRYINNVEKINNSSAMSAFLVEYICAKIYTGEFDYDTYVGGFSGEQLINNLTRNGSYDAAKLLISHFTPARLNSYMAANGYANTYFGGDGEASYTTVEDVMALVSKIADKSSVFPYSDLYKRMKNSNVRNKIRAELPSGVSCANISSVTDGEMFDAGYVYTPNGNYIFVSMANGYSDDGTNANTAIAKGALAVCELLNK